MNPITQSQVEEIVAELSTKCYQTGIKVRIVSDPFVGASMNPRTKELKINQWLLDELPEPQIRGILGHEISHLALKAYSMAKSRKWLVIRGLAALSVIVSVLSFFIRDLRDWLLFIFPLITVVIGYVGFYIPIKDELNADFLAVTLTDDPASFLSAVESYRAKMKGKLKERTKTLLTIIKAIVACICCPRAKLELKFRKEQLQELISNQKSSSTL